MEAVSELKFPLPEFSNLFQVGNNYLFPSVGYFFRSSWVSGVFCFCFCLVLGKILVGEVNSLNVDKFMSSKYYILVICALLASMESSRQCCCFCFIYVCFSITKQ